MSKAGYGRVVLTSSIGGLYSIPNGVPYAVSKSGIIGLNNVVAPEGAGKNIKSNIILPGAVTRMAEGLDVSQYPPMGSDLVAPVVGWLAHESCSVSAEMYVRSEEHTSELQSLMRISYAVFCLKKKTKQKPNTH